MQIKTNYEKKSQNDKTKDRRWNNRGKKEQAKQEKITLQLEEIYQKVLAKERKLKNISTKGKTIQIKQNFPKQRKKILAIIGRDWHENKPTIGNERIRTILDENMATKKKKKMLNG